jgi:general stress protein 26
MEDLSHLRPLVERIKVGMMTTLDADGQPKSRPMQTLELDEHGGLWFFVAADSAKTDEMKRDHDRVGISYADADKQEYVSISGHGKLSRDHERINALWSPWVKVWFPKGAEDPNLALLIVRIERAEYWEAPGSAVKRLYGLAKARATGATDALGEHGEIGAR